MMGYITVPKLKGDPAYLSRHFRESTLQSGIGHLKQTSLPVGGASTHYGAVLAHRGLPTAKLFTDLNLMKKATSSISQYLKSTYAYQVDKIHYRSA